MSALRHSTDPWASGRVLGLDPSLHPSRSSVQVGAVPKKFHRQLALSHQDRQRLQLLVRLIQTDQTT